MAWTNWPVTAGTSDVQDYAWLMQLWEAVRERGYVTGCIANEPAEGHIWPPPNVVWSGGVVTALTDNEDGTWTITDSNKAPAPSGQPDVGYYWNGGRIWPAECGSNHWVGVDCSSCCEPGEPMPYIPASFDVILQITDGTQKWFLNQDPRKVARGSIVGSTSQTLKVDIPLLDWVTAGYVESTTAFVGAKFFIIKSGGQWWADRNPAFGRYPDYPNDNELWRGQATIGLMRDATVGYLHELTNKVLNDPYHDQHPDNNAWEADQFKDKECLVYGSDGLLHRLTIAGNDFNTLYFGSVPEPGESSSSSVEEGEDPEPLYLLTDQQFIIVEPGKKGFPGRTPFAPHFFNGSKKDTTYGHAPDDSVAQFYHAINAATWEWEELESMLGSPAPTCDNEGRRVERNPVDNDMRSSVTNMCPFYDVIFAPALFKSLRHVQVMIEGMVGKFVRPVSYAAAAEIPNYSIARCFHDAEINHGSATVSADNYEVATTADGVTITTYYRKYQFTAAAAYKGVFVFYEVVKDGIRKADTAGEAHATTGNVVVAEYSYGSSADRTAATAGNDRTWLSANVYYSAGWTRYHPKEVSHFYESCVLIPSTTCPPLGGPCAANYPPTAVLDNVTGDADCSKVGTWTWRPPSQGFKTFDVYGFARHGSHGDFQVGDMVRYTGDNWHEPGTGTVARKVGDDIADLKFWDRMYEGRKKLENQNAIDVMKVGLATRGNKNSVTDDQQNWWACWYGGDQSGMAKVHAGTATGGSTTTCVIDASRNDTNSPEHCWWSPSRFIGDIFLNDDGEIVPFKSFVLEVDKEEQQLAEGGEVKHSTDGSGTVIGVYEAGEPMFDQFGDEVMVTNTYKRVIKDVTNLSPSEGSAQQPVIHFDATTNLAGEPLAVAADDAWRIKEPGTNLNYWRGKRVVFTRPDGTKTPEIEVTHNDADTLFFTEQTDPLNVPAEDWTFTIIEQETGGVWKWTTTEPSAADKAKLDWQKVVYKYTTGSEATNNLQTHTVTGYWVQPTGADPRGQNWHPDSRENLPHKSKLKFGKIIKGDYIHVTTYDEMFRMLNRLVWTKKGFDWNNPNPTEKNDHSVFTTSDTCIYYGTCSQGWALSVQCCEEQWLATEGEPLVDDYFHCQTCKPYAIAGGYLGGDASVPNSVESGIDLYYSATFNYPKVTGVCTTFPSVCQFFMKTTIKSDDPEEGKMTWFPEGQAVGPAVQTAWYGNGGNAFEYRKYNLVDTITGQTADRQSNVKVGSIPGGVLSITQPDCPSTHVIGGTYPDNHVAVADSDPATNNTYHTFSTFTGWYSADEIVVMKWNIAGGLKYVNWQA